MLLQITDDFDKIIANSNDMASLEFFNGNGVSFNHIGVMFLPGGEYVYERLSNTIKPIPGAVYSERN